MPNMYRPALCAAAGCFHSIADHATVDGWHQEGAFFVNTTTGARLAARPSEANTALSSAVSNAGLWGGESRLGDANGAALPPEKVALWEAFSRHGTTGDSPSPHIEQPRNVASPSAGHIPDAIPAVDAGVTTHAGPWDDDEDGAAVGGGDATAQRLTQPPPPALSHLDAFPDIPSAVPTTALVNMDFDLTALSAATFRDATAVLQQARPAAQPILSAVPNPLLEQPQELATEAAGSLPQTQILHNGNAALAAAADVQGRARPDDDPDRSQGQPIAPAAEQRASPQENGGFALPDLLATHLRPVYGDPMLVSLSELDPALGDALQRLVQQSTSDAASSLARAGTAVGGGVAIFAVRQTFEEDFALQRFLIVTPFTLMAVAALASRPGWGVLKWERSLMSLRRLTTQPVVLLEAAAAARVAAPAAADGGVIRNLFNRLRPHKLSLTSPNTAAAAKDAQLHRTDIGLLASFAPETSDSITFLRTFRAGRRPVFREGWLTKRKRSSWRERAPLGPLAWKRRYFVLEPTRLLYYAGPPPPVGASGEHGANDGGDWAGHSPQLKGIVPLSGWVEVARTGAEAATSPSGASGAAGSGELHDTTTRAHAFLVRTGKTSHVFSAASDEEADEWVAAIAINAQHLGAAQDDPQCVLLPSAGDAEALASAIARRRRFLVESMSAAGRAALGDAQNLTLDIVTDATPLLLARSSHPSAGRHAVGGESIDPADDEVIDGMRLGDALSIVAAAGGPTNELLEQLPPALAIAVRRRCGIDGDVLQRAPAVAGVKSVDNDAAAVTADLANSWFYLDDANTKRGPFPATRMREWLVARYFGPSTMVRFAGRVPSLHPGCGGDEFGQPVAFLPLSVLFADPATAFVDDSAWIDSYCATMVYQSLIASAAEFGIDPATVANAVREMKEGDLPADLGLLLDLCGVTSLPT